MQFQKKEKRQTTVRFDSHHVRLRTGEVQRKTGSYMYRWTDKLGKRNTIYAATLEDLREQEEQILVDQHDGIKANIKNVTVNDVYELWCQLKRGIKDSTMKNYIYMYELFVKPTFGKKKLVQVKKSDVRRFYNQLIDDKVLKPSTVDVIHNIVHQVFQIAVDDDMIRSNPAANMLREIKMAHGSEIEKRKALTLEQEELFLGYLARTSKYQHWYPVFYIMANTGMRVGEITGLRWCDVDMENGIISVNHTLVYYNHRDEKGCYFSINTPKTKAGIREIPMTEGVKQAFLMEKEFQEECGMKSVSHIEGYSDFVFVNRNGEVQHQGTLNKALQRIMRDCNSEVLEKKGVDSDPVLLPKFSCHVLRHTFATRMCESGLNVKVVQSVLGHADVTTTLDIYIIDNDIALTLEDGRIETAIKDTHASVFIIDPIQAFIPPDADMQSATKMRSVLRKLANIADRNKCAVILIGHMNKGGSSKSLYRGLGSIDIAAIARSVLMISRDESRPDIRYMYPIKSSLAPEGPAIAFSFKEHGGIVWHGKYDLNTAELMDSITVKTTKRERARAKLVQLLEHEDRPAKEVYAGLADIGVGSRTVEKAKKELQVTTYRSGGSWYWSLPKPK